jgi:hypothetical protein
MKTTAALLILLTAVLGRAQTVTLAWDASPSAGVVDYRIHFGTNAGNYAFVTNAGLTLTQTVGLPHPGRWFFAATAVAGNGLESEFSNVVEWEAKPAPPLMNGETWVRLLPVIERSTNGVDWLSITGAPTFLAATNAAEGFLTRRLVIERVEGVMKP